MYRVILLDKGIKAKNSQEIICGGLFEGCLCDYPWIHFPWPFGWCHAPVKNIMREEISIVVRHW